MLTGSSPMPIKGWLLPGLGLGHATVTLSFHSRAVLPWGGENCPPLGLTPSLAALFPHPSLTYQMASGQERAAEGLGPAASNPLLQFFPMGCLGLI